MANYKLSIKAERDISGILEYSYKNFGEKIASDYYLSLKNTFVLLSEQPQIGRNIENIRTGYYCHEHTKHTIFYSLKENSILIIRVLHQNMDFERHL